jgi:hypothetical protein
MSTTINAAQLEAALEAFVACPDEERFAVLFRLLAPQLLVYFRARGCEAGVAEDLTQEVMLTLFRKVDGLRDRDLFRPWLFRIAKNALLQHLRKQGQRVETVALAAAGSKARRGIRLPDWRWASGSRVCRKRTGSCSCCVMWTDSRIMRSRHCWRFRWVRYSGAFFS